MKNFVTVVVVGFIGVFAAMNFIHPTKSEADEAAQKKWESVCARWLLDSNDYTHWSGTKKAPDGWWHYTWIHRERRDETVYIGVDSSGVAEAFFSDGFHRKIAERAKMPNQQPQQQRP